MGAAFDAAIADHLNLPADGINNFLDLIKRRPASVELASAVIGQHDRIGSDFYRTPGITDAHDPLQAECAAPFLPDLRGAVPCHGLVQHSGEVIDHGH